MFDKGGILMSRPLTSEERKQIIDRILMKIERLEALRAEKRNRGVTPVAPSKADNP